MRLIRAQDSYGSWESKSDAELLVDFIVTRKQRRAMPVIGDPEPDVLWRLDMFYTAVALAIEERSGLMTSPMTKMKPMGASDDCFSRPGGWSLCRDVHRFGFETFRKRGGRCETGRRCDCSHRSLSRRGAGVMKPISRKGLCQS
ncbi:DUF269 domain-containing protein [Mesorhizobium sp. M0306]|uniref:DUF269 domain-containing protein n=1 Tax=Mesorhizobium sp. M0306 TaxID=2956932 RepID=UPI00333CD23C